MKREEPNGEGFRYIDASSTSKRPSQRKLSLLNEFFRPSYGSARLGLFELHLAHVSRTTVNRIITT